MSGITLGTRGTGDWETDERPLNWRETILYLYPNGDMPLTALMAKLKSEKTTDPQYNWWTKSLPDQGCAPTAIHTASALNALYSATYANGAAGAALGATVYVNMPEANAEEFRAGHIVVFRCDAYPAMDCVGKVTAVTLNGASSYLTVVLREADDNGGATVNLGGTAAGGAGCDRILIIGNSNEEGAPMPSSISYYPTKLSNYTQIFRTPLSITRTARQTSLRTGDAYQRMKKEALQMHGIEMEKAFFFGIPTEVTGTRGKPERTTGGLFYYIRSGAPDNVSDFRTDSVYTGKKWLDTGGGGTWLQTKLEQAFRYGSGTKMGWCGSGALLGLNNLVQAQGNMQIQVGQASWGINVAEWITPWGTLYLKMHPIMSHESSLRYTLCIHELENMSYRYIQDTTFYGYKEQSGANASGTYGSTTTSGRLDGTDEEYLTEAGLELHHPATMMLLFGIGQDNVL